MASISFHYFEWRCCYYYLLKLISFLFLLLRIFIQKIIVMHFSLQGRIEYSLLKDVTSESQYWTVRTRVVRFSEYLSNDDPPKILRLDLILLDEEVFIHS